MGSIGSIGPNRVQLFSITRVVSFSKLFLRCLEHSLVILNPNICVDLHLVFLENLIVIFSFCGVSHNTLWRIFNLYIIVCFCSLLLCTFVVDFHLPKLSVLVSNFLLLLGSSLNYLEPVVSNFSQFYHDKIFVFFVCCFRLSRTFRVWIRDTIILFLWGHVHVIFYQIIFVHYFPIFKKFSKICVYKLSVVSSAKYFRLAMSRKNWFHFLNRFSIGGIIFHTKHFRKSRVTIYCHKIIFSVQLVKISSHRFPRPTRELSVDQSHFLIRILKFQTYWATLNFGYDFLTDNRSEYQLPCPCQGFVNSHVTVM